MTHKVVIRNISIVLIVFTFCSNSFSQSGRVLRVLTIGDKMPDLTLKTFVNTNYSTAKISYFKGKLIIFDFWSTWCSSCIKSFPKEDSLQSAFKGKLQIFMVNAKKNNDSQKGVQIVLDRYMELNGKKFTTPVIINEISVSERFIFHSIPHCIWVDKTGTIVAITDGEYVTAQNIEKELAGQNINLPIKKD